jgi:hypothetical protein
MMRKFIMLLLILTAPTVYAGAAGHCDLYDHGTGKFITKVSCDLEAKRVYRDIKCNDAEILADANQPVAFITVDSLGDMSIYRVPGCWHKDRAIGYQLYGANSEPDHIRNCTTARACNHVN